MRRTATILALVGLFAALLWSIGRLFTFRFERGDVYPVYSTLRADPLGTKALADSLALMPGLEVRRNYRPLVRLKPGEPVTLAYLGVEYRSRWEEAELKEFERIVSAGSRAVFAFTRERYRLATKRLGATPAPGTPPASAPTPAPTPKPAMSSEEVPGTPFSEVAEGLGFTFDVAQESERKLMDGVAQPASAEFQQEVPWHSALYFRALGPEWKTLYACSKLPVVIERKFGNGSIVLCSDSYFLSNEGLSHNPPGQLLASLFSTPSTIVFDEDHLGVTESANIATLARRMRLQGLALCLIVIAGLFVWKQASSLLPSQDGGLEEDEVTGTDATEGFINLLHRSVPPASLLETCVAAWTRAQGRFIHDDESAHIQAVLRAHGDRSAKDPAAAYRSIAEGLKRK